MDIPPDYLNDDDLKKGVMVVETSDNGKSDEAFWAMSRRPSKMAAFTRTSCRKRLLIALSAMDTSSQCKVVWDGLESRSRTMNTIRVLEVASFRIRETTRWNMFYLR